MATEIERLIVALEARTKSFETAMNKANGIANQRARQIETRFKKLNTSVGSDFTALGRTVLAAFAGSKLLQQVGRFSDAALRIDNSLKIAGLSGQKLDSVFDSLSKSALANGAPLEALVNLYTKAAQAQAELGVTSEELVSFIDNTSLALRINGRSAEEIKGALTQLGQALGSGRVMAEEFNSVNEGIRPILQAAAAGIEEAGGSVSKLRQLTKDGMISNVTFFKGFQAGAVTLRKQAKDTELTIGQAFENVQTSILRLTREFNKSTGAASRFAAGVNDISKYLNGINLNPFIQAIKDANAELESLLNKMGNAQIFKRFNEAIGITEGGEAVNPAFKAKEDEIAALIKQQENLRAAIENNNNLGFSNDENLRELQRVTEELAKQQALLKDMARTGGSYKLVPGQGIVFQDSGVSTYSGPPRRNGPRGSVSNAVSVKDNPVDDPDDDKDKKIEKEKSKLEKNFGELNGAVSNFVDQVIKAESGGDPNAKNPKSSATGVGQFIESTWLNLFRKYYPEEAAHLSRESILALRRDADISRELIEAYASENAELLRKAGVAVNEAALHLAHFLGPGGAVSVLKAAPGTPVANVLSPGAIAANPSILGGGATVDDVIAYAEKRANATKTLADETERAADAQKELNQASQQFQSFGHDLLGGFISDIRNGVSAVDALKNALNKVLDTIIDIALQNFLGSFGAGFGGGAGGLLGGFLIPGILHDGGVAGTHGYGHGRAVSSRTFAGAKRYHSGTASAGGPALRNGEVPAILQRGEVVLPKGAARRSGGQEVVDINLLDNSDRIAAIADQRIETKSGTIINVAVTKANKAAPGVVAKHQYEKTGGDYRNG